MNDLEKLRKITSSLTVLYVEDEEIFRLTVKRKLSGLFKEMLIAKNGIEGLEKFRGNLIDLIITDNIMPEMSGLDMIQEIRKIDTNTPIILLTGFIDTEFLIRAINLGVTQFVAKPIDFKNLYTAIEIATQRVILENLERKTREQELELLKYREKYHFQQQERALKKELNIIKNDLYLKKIDIHKDGCHVEWHCSHIFKPLDIISGDSYSIREIGQGRYFILLVDAMGKGLSASVTTILSTSYINHFVFKAKQQGEFRLEECIDSYYNFIKEELLEDEIVCLSFIDIDFENDKMRYATFSQPPILLLKEIDRDREVLKIRSNNQPIMKFPIPYRIDEVSIKDVTKMLFYSDGLNECFSGNHVIYDEHLERDFCRSYSAKELFGYFGSQMDTPTDDITIIFFNKLPPKPALQRDITINSCLGEISKATEEINSILSNFTSSSEALVLMSAITELLFNAYEHGNIDLEATEKRKLIAQDLYEDYLKRQEATNTKRIHIKIRIYPYGDCWMLLITIADEGKGFDVRTLLKCGNDCSEFSGRGVKIAQTIADGIYYSHKGNEVTLIKKLDKEADNGG